MGTEEAILYSYDLATLPSILPAFASKKDLILCDEVRVGAGRGYSRW
jgi:serine palmitoyltransferase